MVSWALRPTASSLGLHRLLSVTLGESVMPTSPERLRCLKCAQSQRVQLCRASWEAWGTVNISVFTSNVPQVPAALPLFKPRIGTFVTGMSSPSPTGSRNCVFLCLNSLRAWAARHAQSMSNTRWQPWALHKVQKPQPLPLKMTRMIIHPFFTRAVVRTLTLDKVKFFFSLRQFSSTLLT